MVVKADGYFSLTLKGYSGVIQGDHPPPHSIQRGDRRRDPALGDYGGTDGGENRGTQGDHPGVIDVLLCIW